MAGPVPAIHAFLFFAKEARRAGHDDFCFGDLGAHQPISLANAALPVIWGAGAAFLPTPCPENKIGRAGRRIRKRIGGPWRLTAPRRDGAGSTRRPGFDNRWSAAFPASRARCLRLAPCDPRWTDFSEPLAPTGVRRGLSTAVGRWWSAARYDAGRGSTAISPEWAAAGDPGPHSLGRRT